MCGIWRVTVRHVVICHPVVGHPENTANVYTCMELKHIHGQLAGQSTSDQKAEGLNPAFTDPVKSIVFLTVIYE